MDFPKKSSKSVSGEDESPLSGQERSSGKDVRRPPAWVPGPTGWVWASAFSVVGLFFGLGNPLVKPMQAAFLFWCLLPYLVVGFWLFSGKFKIRRGTPARELPKIFMVLTILVYWLPLGKAAFDSPGEFVVFSPIPFWLAMLVVKGLGKWMPSEHR